MPWLASLDPASLARVATQADLVRFADGARLMTELEVGQELFILVEGTATVTVASTGGTHQEVGRLGAGDACGEIALLSGELHSATVAAVGPVAALRLDRDELEELVSRHPQVLGHFARVLASRVVDTDRALDALLDVAPTEHPEKQLAGRSAAVVPGGRSVRRAWRELVVSRRRELPFLALTSFAATLFAVRLVAFALERAGVPLLDLLRSCYTAGIALVFASTATSLVRFRPGVRRLVALTYGVGFALILNELSVFLAFDTFYLDMTTRDPALMFSVEALYRRNESTWAVLVMLALLAQMTFLGSFYRRGAWLLLARVDGALRRR